MTPVSRGYLKLSVAVIRLAREDAKGSSGMGLYCTDYDRRRAQIFLEARCGIFGEFCRLAAERIRKERSDYDVRIGR